MCIKKHLVASGTPSISPCPGCSFYIWVIPQAFMSRKEIKAEQYNSTAQHSVTSQWLISGLSNQP